MYEYKVLDLNVKECEETFNQLAKAGWRLVTVSPNIVRGRGGVATMEKKIEK